MKKSIVLMMSILLLVGLASSANAFSYTEEYNGYQYVAENKSYNFGFDMWYDNDKFNVGTDSYLTLTSDAEGAFDAWLSATMSIDFYSKDWAKETASIELTAWNSSGGGESFNLGTISGYLGGWGDGGETYEYSYEFTADQILTFEEWGWGNVTISAVSTWCLNYNDFAITSVGLTVETAPVPEPATMLLLGTGLIGLAAGSRKKIFKK